MPDAPILRPLPAPFDLADDGFMLEQDEEGKRRRLGRRKGKGRRRDGKRNGEPNRKRRGGE